MEGFNMPVDKEKIRQALDHFENDEYTEAQDILKGEIAKHRDEWLADKLELEGTDSDDEDEDDEDEDDEDEDDEDEDDEDEDDLGEDRHPALGGSPDRAERSREYDAAARESKKRHEEAKKRMEQQRAKAKKA